MQVKEISKENFLQYGRILTKEYNVAELIEKMKEFSVPNGVEYIPSVECLENCNEGKLLMRGFGGELPMQIGYCIGYNKKLNALEYHRSSEVNIAATDLILMLGKQADVEENYFYDTSKVETFFIPKGMVVELFATTLHYAPCNVFDSEFKALVLLPRGTNNVLTIQEQDVKEDALLQAKNKWLLAHEEAGIDGAYIGLTGDNLELKE